MLHLAALVAWVAAGVFVQARLWRSQGDLARELRARRSLEPLLMVEHAALAVALGSGWLLMAARGWGLGHARWLAVKVGLALFLLLPLEGMHAYVCHVWIARGLRQTEVPPFSRDLERGVGMDGMLRAMALPLLGLALPLLAWLSFRKPW